MNLIPNKRKTFVPRGIRNNNPLNIRIGNVWLGEVSNPDDPEFEQFVSMIYGLRAAFVLLRRYIRHYHRDTLESIIRAWSPSNENKTEDYIKAVSNLTALDEGTVIEYSDKPTMVSIVEAMAYVETGQHLKEDVISKAYDMA